MHAASPYPSGLQCLTGMASLENTNWEASLHTRPSPNVRRRHSQSIKIKKSKSGQGELTCSPILRWARSRHSTRPGIGKYRLGRITTHAAFTKRVQEHIPVGQKQNRKNGQGVSACLPILRWDRSQHSTRPDTLETRPPSQTPSALRWWRTSSITETSSPRCPPSKLTTVAPIWCATFRIPSAPPK